MSRTRIHTYLGKGARKVIAWKDMPRFVLNHCDRSNNDWDLFRAERKRIKENIANKELKRELDGSI